MTAPDPARCPLCGELNACQVAAGCSTCWCFDTPVPASVLARVPVAAQGVACVCKRCATEAAADAATAPTAPSAPPVSEAGRRSAALRWIKR